MASYPSITFANNETTPVFNSNTFQTKTVQSDNLTTTSLNVLGPSTLNTVTSNTITNTGALTSSGLMRANGGLSAYGTTLNYGTLTSAGLLTCNGGLFVNAGTVTFNNNAIAINAVNGANTRITATETNIVKLQNATSGTATTGTISTNILSIDYNANNNQTIIIVPTANFAINITNVPTSSLYAIYTCTLLINAKFFCNSITVNGTSISMNAFNGFANLTVNASAAACYQTLYIIFAGSTTPVKVTTNLTSIW